MRWFTAAVVFLMALAMLTTAESQDLQPYDPIASEEIVHPKVREGCLDCHSGLADGEYLHMMDSDDDCLFCHELVSTQTSPGEPRNQIMMTFASNMTCEACHVEQEMSHQDENPHSYFDCTNCHAPHSSDYEHLFVQSELKLCSGSCHGDWDIGITHPVGEEVADMITGSSMSCISSCHGMHLSGEEKLLQVAYDDLCAQCHEDQS